MDIDIRSFDGVHLWGDSATHSPAPRSPRHAALLPLQGAAQPEAEPVRAVQGRAGVLGAAALTLAWHADHGTGERVQLPFPGWNDLVFIPSTTDANQAQARDSLLGNDLRFILVCVSPTLVIPACAAMTANNP
ncbi:MAG: hypothetical protein LBQ32_04775, partial [Burkholderiaceae bacterium]|nr:hypothetical protein [Burkholderiaceae bacterium]